MAEEEPGTLVESAAEPAAETEAATVEAPAEAEAAAEPAAEAERAAETEAATVEAPAEAEAAAEPAAEAERAAETEAATVEAPAEAEAAAEPAAEAERAAETEAATVEAPAEAEAAAEPPAETEAATVEAPAEAEAAAEPAAEAERAAETEAATVEAPAEAEAAAEPPAETDAATVEAPAEAEAAAEPAAEAERAAETEAATVEAPAEVEPEVVEPAMEGAASEPAGESAAELDAPPEAASEPAAAVEVASESVADVEPAATTAEAPPGSEAASEPEAATTPSAATEATSELEPRVEPAAAAEAQAEPEAEAGVELEGEPEAEPEVADPKVEPEPEPLVAASEGETEAAEPDVEPEPEPEVELEREPEAGKAQPVQGRVKKAASIPAFTTPPPASETFIDNARGLAVNAYRDLASARAREAQIISELEAGTRKECQGIPGAYAKFEDEEFPADARSLFRDPDQPWYGHVPVETLGPWLRPAEIGDTPDEPPSLFLGGIGADDVIQGALGDCWFLGAISALSTRPELLKSIFVSATTEEDQQRCQKYGIYILKFYKWVEDDSHTDIFVVIDDRIPCNQLGKPLYARSGSEDEMWVMLIEKGYAKLHRNYENLKTGFVDYALRDLTGGISEQVKWTRPQDEAALASKAEEIFQRCVTCLDLGCLLGCSATVPKGRQREVDTEGYGILKGHAYSLLAYATLTESETGFVHRLLRVRNPWGQREWEGRWGDNTVEWELQVLSADGSSVTALEEINRQLKDRYMKRDEIAEQVSFGSLPEMAKFEFGNDGTFWMNCNDFAKHYSTLFVLRDLPTGEWDGKRIDGRWQLGDDGTEGSAGGSPVHQTFLKNPQYMVTITEPTEMLVLLEQPDLRMCYEGKSDPFSSAPAPPMFPEAIGVVVVKVPEAEAAAGVGLAELQKDDVVGMTRAWCKQRDVSLEVKLDAAGTYAVIPSTYDAGVASRFRINLWTHTAEGSGYFGEKPKVASSNEACLVTDLGTTDLGYDSETLPEDQCEVEEEASAAQKASAETLRDVSRELRKLSAVVKKQHDMLEEQKSLIDQLLKHKGGSGSSSNPITTTSSAAASPAWDTVTAESPRGGAVQMLPSTAASLKEQYYEICVELGCGGTDKRCRMHGDDCTGPNEKVAVTLSGVAMDNGAPAGEMLDLSYHLIGDKGMLAVGKVLQKWVALTTLVLKGNGIRDEAALVLAASLRGRKLPKIVYIDLSDNQISDEGANALAKLVEGTPTLVNVSLDNNPAISEGARAAVRMACETNDARNKMMQEAAKIYLNTNDPAFLLRTMQALSL